MLKRLMLTLLTFVMFSFNYAQQSVKGEATWYAYKNVRKTASGKTFNNEGMTCAAHTRYKFGTKLKVTNLENNKSVIVIVTDRGLFMYSNPNQVDLSRGAFRQIADLRKGRIKVKVEVIQ